MSQPFTSRRVPRDSRVPKLAVLHVLAGVLSLAVPGGAAYLLARRDMGTLGRVSRPTFILMLLGFLGLGTAILWTVLARAWPLPLRASVAAAIGAPVALAGLGLCLAARGRFTFRRTWGLDMDRLVTDSVYGWTRNPQVVGWFLIYAGAGVMGRSAAALVLAGFFIAACIPWIMLEEATLARRFGEEYRQYRARTPRFFPAAPAHPRGG